MKTLSVAEWSDIFKSLEQVERVVDASAERLGITIKDRKDILYTTASALNSLYQKNNCYPHEVVTSFLKEHGVLVYYQNTLVAYFDIHAYSAFINNSTSLDAIKKINNLFSNMKNIAPADIKGVKLDLSILSDSIILVVDTNRHPLFSCSLEFFLATCSLIMRTSMEHGFPLRGAIGGGYFYKDDKDGEVIVSSALVDAVDYEERQDWLGTVLTQDAIKIIEKAEEMELKFNGKSDIDLSSDRFKSFVRCGKIPWKSEESQKGKYKIDRTQEWYYIKPSMAEKEWEKFLPTYFKSSDKIKASHLLYAQE